MAKIRNRYGVNLTGGQLDAVVTHYLVATLRPIVLKTKFVDEELTDLFSAILQDSKKKLTVEKSTTLQNLVAAMTQPHNRQQMLVFLSESGLSRDIWQNIFCRFEEATQDYQKYYWEWLTAKSLWQKWKANKKCSRIERAVGGNRDSLYAAVTDFRHGFSCFRQYLDDFLYQFSALMQTMAQIHLNKYALPSSRDDLLQVMHENALRAAFLYTSRAGAVTSYAKYWLFNALSSPEQNLGLAFDLPPSERKKIACGQSPTNNIALSTDVPLREDGTTLGQLLPSQQQQNDFDVESVARLIKIADPTGVLRLTKHIDEVFTPDEVVLMKTVALT